MYLCLSLSSGEDVSPDKDGGIIKSTLTEGSGYQSPNDYSAVSSKLLCCHAIAKICNKLHVRFKF